MKRHCYRPAIAALALALVAVAGSSRISSAGVIYASGQRLVPGDPDIPPGQPGHDDTREDVRVPVIVNDMSEVNIDAALTRGGQEDLSRTDEQLFEMSNGCIGCRRLKWRLKRMNRRRCSNEW